MCFAMTQAMDDASRVDSCSTLHGFAAQWRMVRLLILQPWSVTVGTCLLTGQFVTSLIIRLISGRLNAK